MRYNYGAHGCTGIVYDGVELSDMFTIVDVSIPLLPTIDVVTQELVQRPGLYFSSRKIGTREVKIKLSLDAESRCPIDIFTAWSEVSGVFAKPDPRRLYLNGSYINALFVGESEIEEQGTKGVIELTFLCFDPFFYGKEHTVSLSGTTAFSVSGGVSVFPILQVTGAATPLTVTNPMTSELVRVPNITTGAKVVVDMANQIATVNGSFAPVDLVSDFFALETGDSNLKLSSGTGSLTYQERFL